jgi:cell division protein FtsL
VAAPKRSRTVADRLARQEAKLLAAVVACTTVVCGLLVVYLAAYAQVASLGIQMSKARVELRKERLLGETLRAQVARAASPARISSAAVKNGMVLQRAEQICYVNPSDEPGFSTKPVNGTNSISTRTAQNDTTTGTTNEQADSRIARPESNASTGKNTGPRMASRGTITDTYTTASVAN